MKQSSELVTIAVALFDLALIALAFYTAYWLRFGDFDKLGEFIWLFYLSAPAMVALLLHYGVLSGFRYQSLPRIVRSTVKAFVIVGFIASTLLYLSKAADYSRLLFGYYFSLATTFVLAGKILMKYLYARLLRRGGMNVRVAVVGFGQKCAEIVAELERHPQWGIAPVLMLDPRSSDSDAIVAAVRAAVIDEVYFACPRNDTPQQLIDTLLQRFEQMGYPTRIRLNFDELQGYCSQHHCLMAGQPGVLLTPYSLDPDQMIIKRTMDICGAVVGLLLLGLVLPFVALAIRLDSPGPVFYAQRRVGKGGREFQMYKFRSMHVDADQRKEELLEDNVHSGPLFKVRDDPRVTRVGRWLRKHSLDELPQFWNVLRGDMSLVGVRPPTVAEVEQYKDHHFMRISFRPGLTGLWQVSGRNALSEFENIVALDAQYIRNWGFWLDVRILLRTIRVVLFPAPGGAM